MVIRYSDRHKQTDSLTDRQTDRQTDGQAGRQADRQTETDRQLGQAGGISQINLQLDTWLSSILTDTDRQTEGQTDRRRDRQTDRQTGIDRDRQTAWSGRRHFTNKLQLDTWLSGIPTDTQTVFYSSIKAWAYLWPLPSHTDVAQKLRMNH